MDPFATDAHGPFRNAELLSAGRNDRALRWAVDRGELVRVVPGVFARADEWAGLSSGPRHLLTARALADRPDSGALGLVRRDVAGAAPHDSRPRRRRRPVRCCLADEMRRRGAVCLQKGGTSPAERRASNARPAP